MSNKPVKLDYSSSDTAEYEKAVRRTVLNCFVCAVNFPVEIIFDVGTPLPALGINVKCHNCN